MAKDYRTEGQNVTKSRLIQAIKMNLLPGLFFTHCLITYAVFVLNYLLFFTVYIDPSCWWVFFFLETDNILVRMSVVYKGLDDVDCIRNCFGSVSKLDQIKTVGPI